MMTRPPKCVQVGHDILRPSLFHLPCDQHCLSTEIQRNRFDNWQNPRPNDKAHNLIVGDKSLDVFVRLRRPHQFELNF